MQKLIPFLISSFLLIGVFGCQEAPKTGSETPATTNESAQVPAKETAQTTETAAKEAPERIKQVPETADKSKVAITTTTTNVKTLAFNKLQKKLPGSNLEVDEKDGVVTVTGTVTTPADIKKIEPIVKTINGVKTVKVAAKLSTEKKADDNN
jgi:osmotically-inducible protein OsmY